LFTDSLEYGGNDLLNPISQAEEAALDVLVIVSQYFVKLVEELDILLDRCHPSEVLLYQKQECKDAFTSYDDMLVLKESHKGL
jgi:hypothetical protein